MESGNFTFLDLINMLIKYEREFLNGCAVTMVLVGIIVFCILLFIPATYGRYSCVGRFYSIAIPVQAAWFLQEIPSFLVSSILIILAHNGTFEQQYNFLQLAVLSCFIFHYFQRSFYYSLSITGGKPTPLFAFVLATLFCSVNGYMQARGALLLSTYPNDVLTLVRVAVGVTLFIIGLVINIHSDYVLRNLRKPGEKGYKIPYGGFYEYVSCANFFGEIVEWFGFFIASWSTVSFAFCFFTSSNLIPRAISHHKWYLEKFDDYPKERKIVIPFIF